MIGQGLESLIPKKGNIKEDVLSKKENVFWLEVEKIKPNPYQPRKIFEEEDLYNLAESIKKYGVLQPLIVTKTEKSTKKGVSMEYQLIAGERRLRACELAGIKRVPAVIRDPSNKEKLEVALIENVQRKNLNSVDKAEAFERLKQEFGLLEKEIAAIAGTSREVVSNALRLLALPEEVKNALRSEKITEGHAKALLMVKDVSNQLKVFKELITENLSVRKIEQMARELNNPSSKKQTVKINTEPFEKQFRKVFDYEKVKVRNKDKGFQVVVDFDSEEEMKKWIKKF